MDAAAYIVEILEMGLRYFNPKDFDSDDPFEIEREYDILKDEYNEPSFDDWKIVV
jgi:hypothetical protein